MATRTTLTRLLGAIVSDEDGVEVARVVDLVVDLARPSHPVSRVVVRAADAEEQLAPQVLRLQDTGRLVLTTDDGGAPLEPLLPTELRLEREVLDSPVVLADPPRRTRVSDVVLEFGPEQTTVVGLDLSAGTAWRRLLRRPARGDAAQVPMSQVHLMSGAGHAAHLATPGSLVFRLGPADMAEVLTRMSVGRAREVLAAADEQVAGEAVELLHPHVRSRLSSTAPAPRRLLRTRGWRLHRPPVHQGRKTGPKDVGT